MDHRTKYKYYNYKTLRIKQKSKSLWSWIRQGFLNTTLKTQVTKKIDKLHQNLKLSCFKGHHQKMSRKPRMGENICKHISDKGLASRIYKELYSAIIKTQPN